MEVVISPAMLGALVAAIALSAWALGRWQGSATASMAAPEFAPAVISESAHAPANPSAVPDTPWPASPCQQNAADERRHVVSGIGSLADLHEDISAFRRREQVLASLDPDTLFFDNAQPDCRFVGITGTPLCPAPVRVRRDCGMGCGVREACQPTRSAPVQPSREVPALLRV